MTLDSLASALQPMLASFVLAQHAMPHAPCVAWVSQMPDAAAPPQPVDVGTSDKSDPSDLVARCAPTSFEIVDDEPLEPFAVRRARYEAACGRHAPQDLGANAVTPAVAPPTPDELFIGDTPANGSSVVSGTSEQRTPPPVAKRDVCDVLDDSVDDDIARVLLTLHDSESDEEHYGCEEGL